MIGLIGDQASIQHGWAICSFDRGAIPRHRALVSEITKRRPVQAVNEKFRDISPPFGVGMRSAGRDPEQESRKQSSHGKSRFVRARRRVKELSSRSCNAVWNRGTDPAGEARSLVRWISAKKLIGAIARQRHGGVVA